MDSAKSAIKSLVLDLRKTLESEIEVHLRRYGISAGDVATDQAAILDALRQGRAWVACDVLGSTRGFWFQARSGLEVATLGGEVSRAGAVTLEATTPLPGNIQLVCNGRVIAHTFGQACKHLVTEAGAYRVQVYRGGKGWIFSNPILVR